ncbi:DUF1534 domain-containing protein [Pseudomonas syringae]|uniref:DUF1534 domain-containing protein n=1 Tax=Pseudomonas syringae TaxID=317 RepID=A0A9Q4A6I9_PSESX|nr:DUF1534 domain-containing protein [Pseudomonas syringae]MCF5474484.1 DUF1534 domain-containing protein [Pseudomonas syringae]MCF5484638.1 DUF1534 domain-containing protein [Pseudomonas syringae]MCF5489623.1 DUF1534 domain-containing protein [Pseudomonas syringae]MCF5492962.1 DUF1534 domain-containing protein [Pseudomonas syringae]
MPGFDEVAGHGRTHVAQTDKCDVHCCSPWYGPSRYKQARLIHAKWSRHLSFRTLQRGSAFRDAPRHTSALRRALRSDAECPKMHVNAERCHEGQLDVFRTINAD